MKKNRKWIVVGAAALCAIGLGAAALAAAGDSTDPLVTLSYLTQVFTPQVEQAVDDAVAADHQQLLDDIDAALEEWEEQLGTGGSSEPVDGASVFHVVTLSKGQTLVGEIGCEIILRVGSAVCVTDENPGLIDCTGATTLNDGGSLIKNHLYMVTIETRGVQATASVTKVLVRGPYTVVDGE